MAHSLKPSPASHSSARLPPAGLLRTAATLLVLACSAPALDLHLRVSQLHKQYWGVEQGLPHGYVTALAQSADGFLLVGTDEGLARFDGLAFRPLAADPALRLGQKWISAQLAARDGSLWIGTFEGQLLQLRAGRPARRFDARGSVFSILEDPAGLVWVSTRSGVFQAGEGPLRVAPNLSAPPETAWNVLALHRTPGGDGGPLWVVDGQGLALQRKGATERVLLNGGAHGEVLTVLTTSRGETWIGASRGLFRLPSRTPQSPEPLPAVEGPVVSLLEDRDGALWAGTWGHGLARVSPGGAEKWTAADGLPDDFIRTLFEDAEGNLWIGMRSGGLGRWKNPRIVPVGLREGIAGDYASIVAPGPGGDLWLGTWRAGLYRQRGAALAPQPTPLPTLYFTARAMAFAPGGNPWMGNWEGLFEFDGRSYRHYAEHPESPYRRVSAMLFDHTGALWVGTAGKGLFRFPSGRPADPAPPPLLPDAQVTALLEDSSRRLWVGTAMGLFLASPGQSLRSAPGLPAEHIESLFEDSARRLWASTAAGSLFVLDGERHLILDRAHGLPAHPLYRVLEATDGDLWISSPRGILQLPRADVDAVLAGRRPRLEILSYGQADGMRTIECHGLSQPAGWRAPDGVLWFPTARGFVQVRPAAPTAALPPTVRIEEVRLGAAPTTSPLALTPPVLLHPGARDLQIQFTGLRLGRPHRLRFRYRLAGFDPAWVDAGGRRNATYNQLPPGVHTFEVQARDGLGPWGPAATLAIDQQPRFYQTPWFVLLLAVALAATIYAIYRWRVHSLRTRYAVVLEERNRIGREWHDTLVAGFSAISLQLEAANARLRGQPDRASEILDVTRQMVHHYRAEARRVIWDLRDSRPDDESLRSALDNALRRAVDNRPVEFALEVTGVECPLPAELRHNVLRICQEAMSNAVRHGAPTRLTVGLHYAAGELQLSVEDDGRGFEESLDPVAGHFGLTVMQERARRHGGRLTIESQPGRGTRLQAVIPIKRTSQP